VSHQTINGDLGGKKVAKNGKKVAAPSEVMPTAEEADESWQNDVFESACHLVKDRMTSATRTHAARPFSNFGPRHPHQELEVDFDRGAGACHSASVPTCHRASPDELALPGRPEPAASASAPGEPEWPPPDAEGTGRVERGRRPSCDNR
jgi:hypothetical protein